MIENMNHNLKKKYIRKHIDLKKVQKGEFMDTIGNFFVQYDQDLKVFMDSDSKNTGQTTTKIVDYIGGPNSLTDYGQDEAEVADDENMMAMKNV